MSILNVKEINAKLQKKGFVKQDTDHQKQVRLKKPEFMKLIECTLSAEDYKKILIKNGEIEK